MNRAGLIFAACLVLAGCGDDEEASGLTSDERQRLEEIADRLDENMDGVRQTLEADGNEVEETPSDN